MESVVQAHDLVFRIFLEEDAINSRVKELGAELRIRYAGQTPVFLGVLNGSFMFTADLARAFGEDCEVSFIKLASYRGTKSSGDVATLIGLETDLRNRHVIIVEDIVDSGKTLQVLLQELRQLQPASLEIAALLQKPEMLEHPIHVEYVGFSIPPHFVIGYGLDYNGLGRQYPAIYQLAKDAAV
jgi:hypoxanthine phosphoribosyltransferase